MNVTLELDELVEIRLAARAAELGVNLQDYLRDLVSKDAGLSTEVDRSRALHQHFGNLSNFLLQSPLAGADLDLSRPVDYPRSLSIE